jgi:hypothetical protein
MSQPVSNSPETPSSEMGTEDVIDFLGAEDEPEVLDLPKPKPTKVPPSEGDARDEEVEGEEPDELAELEQELEPPTEEQLELVTPVRRREILSKYPQLFKDFPYLEKAYYREQQFTELLPTIDDARAAVEARDVLNRFEADVMNGNTEKILKAVKQDSPNGFAKIVDDYLPALARVDEQAYFHVIGNATKHTIIAMVREARASNNEALQSAAQILNQFVFGTSDWKAPTNLAKEEPKDSGKSELDRERQEFRTQKFESARGDLNTRINNTLSNTIDANIDPKKSMTDYVRKNASREAMEMLSTVLDKDSRFVALKDKLWEYAFRNNFNRESVERIKSAYLSRAKTLLPTVIKKARIDALKGLGKRVDDEEDKAPNKSPLPMGRPRSSESSNKGGKIKDAKDIPKGMRTIDFLNSD